MFVQEINWLDPVAHEAEITVTDGEFSIKCYSYPCYYLPGEVLVDRLECFDAKEVVRVRGERPSVYKQGMAFGYFLCGKVIDYATGEICIGKLRIGIDRYAIPGDISNGDFVCFSTSRVDVW